MIARAKPAVVSLKGLTKSGSGFFVTEKGVIATNAHLARGEGSLLAILSGGEQLTAKIIHIDPTLDIAVLKIEGDHFPCLTLAATSSVRQGQTVIAVGNPGGEMRRKISCRRTRAVDPDRCCYQPWKQRRSSSQHKRGSDRH